MGCADIGPTTQSPKRATRLGPSRTQTEHKGRSSFMGSDAGHPLLHPTPSIKRSALEAAISSSAEL